jgi:GNAT superfamily N-acetyltransferase
MDVDKQKIDIGDGYTAKEVSSFEFSLIFKEYRQKIFNQDLDFHFLEALSEGEKESRNRLADNLRAVYQLHFLIYHEDVLIGWSFGVQRSQEEFHMVNTAIFPEFQGRGVYSRFLAHLLEFLSKQGFQVVSSRHRPSNVKVLVPKLKAGFLITGMQVTDIFGVLVELSYYFNQARADALRYRMGSRLKDERVKSYFKPIL